MQIVSQKSFFIKNDAKLNDPFASIKESGLFVFNTKLAVNGSKNALHLTHSEHTAKQSISGIVSMTGLIHYAAGLIGKCHTVVNTHGQ